ncbi:MAG: glucosaminidase domain-containing protein [Actinomycetota bacterium]|nr:glucosaminidase domain-containing protein [Actinomycetota bacterium]
MTEGQVVRYLVPKYNGAYTDADIRWIVGRDFDVSVKAGVDPLVVIAQMDHETGHLSSYWSQRPRRNPAGIGVTGAPGAGVSFPRWYHSVDAHIGSGSAAIKRCALWHPGADPQLFSYRLRALPGRRSPELPRLRLAGGVPQR